MNRNHIAFGAAFMTVTGLLWAGEFPKFNQMAFNAGPVNSPQDDYAPAITADGKTMIFDAKRRGERYKNLYIATRQGDQWDEPKPLSAVNSRYNDETPYISPDGRVLIFASDRDGSTEMPKNSMGQVRISADLYWSRKKSGGWTPPQKLPGTINTMHHERAPHMGPDGTTLYYTTWPFGDIKKSQIMKAVFKGGRFVNAQKLPAPINTGNQELGLTFAPDGKGVYFSSARKAGYGGWDLYYADYKDGTFSGVRNLGENVNTPANEVYMIDRGPWIYFCSNRNGGYGRYDIYSNQKQSMEMMDFLVREKGSEKPIETALNFKAKATLPGGQKSSAAMSKTTDRRGEVQLKVNQALNSVDVFAKKDGYLPYFKTIDLHKWRKDKPRVVVELTPLAKNNSFDVHAIHFDYNSAKIKSESFAFLNRLADYLAENKHLNFEIIGHTDMHGSDEFNLKLSKKRAQAVKGYLTSRGLSAARFSVTGKGESQPKVRATGPEADEANRRTEFRVKNTTSASAGMGHSH